MYRKPYLQGESQYLKDRNGKSYSWLFLLFLINYEIVCVTEQRSTLWKHYASILLWKLRKYISPFTLLPVKQCACLDGNLVSYQLQQPRSVPFFLCFGRMSPCEPSRLLSWGCECALSRFGLRKGDPVWLLRCFSKARPCICVFVCGLACYW